MKPNPFVLESSTDKFRIGAFRRITFPGLPVRSQLDGRPAWKSACEVSVKHPLLGAGISTKFWIVVPPLVTKMLPAVPEFRPG